MRNISFFLTKQQFLDGTKDVTRRLGWKSLKSGDKLMGVEKGQGIKKGELVRFGPIEVISARIEPLYIINQEEVRREGFPEISPDQFITMFCKHMKCIPQTAVTRIEFKKILDFYCD